MKKPIIGTVFIVFLLAGTIVFAQNPKSVSDFLVTVKSAIFTSSESIKSDSEQISSQNNSTVNKTIPEFNRNALSNQTPDHVFYDMFFNLVKSLDGAAAKRESDGGSGKMWRDYIKNRINLNPQQMAKVRRVTNQFQTAVRPIHERAMQIIAEKRASRSNGQPSSPPSQELVSLQEQRESIALTYGNRLKTTLDNETVEQLRQKMQQARGTQSELSDEDFQMLQERARRFRENQTTSNQAQGGNNNE